ncbi:hypothetical protein F4V89_08030 [Neorhizobium galegae]|nr:hypothetical protein F4V88_12370 [Neorhizobium galegae]KAB1114351.1 hypothetical protein F4V89_08030 [Neorhizobium galegae]
MRVQWFEVHGPRLRALSRSPWRVESLRLLRHNVGGRSAAGLSQADQDATAVSFRTGSGDRLTSRRCHEITSAVLFRSGRRSRHAESRRKKPRLTHYNLLIFRAHAVDYSHVMFAAANCVRAKTQARRQALEISYFVGSRIWWERSI